MSSRKSCSKRHISSTPINKSRDKPEVAAAKNSTRDSDSDSQPEVTEHSSEESDAASMEDDDISDESRQGRESSGSKWSSSPYNAQSAS